MSEEAVQKQVQVGDRVQYVPSEAHTFDRDAAGDYPWVLGWRSPNGQVMEELQGRRIGEVLTNLRRLPPDNPERKRLTFLRPVKTWPAEVRSVNSDGTVDLDIQSSSGGVTLHYAKVPLATSGVTPGSCIASPPTVEE